MITDKHIGDKNSSAKRLSYTHMVLFTQVNDVWFASPMLLKLNYEFKSVRVCNISETYIIKKQSLLISKEL